MASDHSSATSHPHGTDHKIAHNLTTLLNIPLVAWLIYSIVSLRGAGYEDVTAWISQPFNLVAAILFIIVTLKHFVLELEVVFEDYISLLWFRRLKITGMKIVFFILGLTAILSLLKVGL